MGVGSRSRGTDDPALTKGDDTPVANLAGPAIEILIELGTGIVRLELWTQGTAQLATWIECLSGLTDRMYVSKYKLLLW